MNTAIVTFIFSMAGLSSWVLAFERVPNEVAEFLVNISDNPIIFLLLLNIILFITGMFIDGIPAMIILVPILLPVAMNLGIDPVHFGIIVSINLTIGLITPPVGTALFIATSIGGIRMETLARTLIPFIFVAYLMLLIITYVPSITLLIPNLFG
jgi:tripartite ATP-independent transporter DctM subunit